MMVKEISGWCCLNLVVHSVVSQCNCSCLLGSPSMLCLAEDYSLNHRIPTMVLDLPQDNLCIALHAENLIFLLQNIILEIYGG